MLVSAFPYCFALRLAICLLLQEAWVVSNVLLVSMHPLNHGRWLHDSAPPTCRFSSASEAEKAVQNLDGLDIAGMRIKVRTHCIWTDQAPDAVTDLSCLFLM